MNWIPAAGDLPVERSVARNWAFATVAAEIAQHRPEFLEETEVLLLDVEYFAALFLLAELRDARVWMYVGTEAEPADGGDRRRILRGIDFERMFDREPWSASERLLLRSAASLFNGSCTLPLSELADTVGDRHWNAVLTAMAIRRGRCS